MHQRPDAKMARTGTLEYLVDLGTIAEPGRGTSRISRQLPDKVAGELLFVVEQQALEFANVAKRSAIRQFATRVHCRPRVKCKFLTVLADACKRIALAIGAVGFAPAAQHIEIFERKPGRIHFCMASRATGQRAMLVELLPDG